MPSKRKNTTKTSDSKTASPSTSEISVLSLRYEPSAIAQTLDVGRLHSILRSAETGDTRDLMALYRDIIANDSHLQGEFAKRKMSVVGDTFTIVPASQDAADVLAADVVRDNIQGTKAWRLSMAHLLDSALYPVALAEKIYTPTGVPTAPFVLSSLVRVPHHLLDFTSGHLRLYDVDPENGSILSTTHEPDPERYIIHRGHILTMPDNWGGPMRSLLFWWLLSTMTREWWTRFLDRYGQPFLVGSYARGDKDAKSVLERAFQLSVRLGGLVVSEGTTVELKQAATTSSGDSYERFISLCNREKSKLIVGQTLSAEATPTGLGSGVAEQQETVRQDIRKFDASGLAETFRDQLFSQILHVSNIQAAVPTMVFGKDIEEDASKLASTLTKLRATDAEPDDNALASFGQRLGFGVRRRTSSQVGSPVDVFSRSLS